MFSSIHWYIQSIMIWLFGIWWGELISQQLEYTKYGRIMLECSVSVSCVILVNGVLYVINMVRFVFRVTGKQCR